MAVEEKKRNRENFYFYPKTHKLKINSAVVHNIWPLEILTFLMLIFIMFSKRQILSLSFCCWWIWGRTQLNGLARLKKRGQAKDHVHCSTLLKLLILLGIYVYLNHFMFRGNKTGCLILHFWEREGKMTSPADGGLVRSIQVLPGDLFLRYYLLTSLKSIDDNSRKWMRVQTPSTLDFSDMEWFFISIRMWLFIVSDLACGMCKRQNLGLGI